MIWEKPVELERQPGPWYVIGAMEQTSIRPVSLHVEFCGEPYRGAPDEHPVLMYAENADPRYKGGFHLSMPEPEEGEMLSENVIFRVISWILGAIASIFERGFTRVDVWMCIDTLGFLSAFPGCNTWDDAQRTYAADLR